MKRAVHDLVGRRAFFGKLGAAAAGLGATTLLSDEDLEGAVQNVSRSSSHQMNPRIRAIPMLGYRPVERSRTRNPKTIIPTLWPCALQK